ncbi:PREDICTED: serine-rich adhesin for platelets-like [Rhagoletis zephyria]|uniref:serine-rich adhesin for platelets-like n=1 Tax=Rhagoletis zephyria TaxID=28612 RepID=UPI00081149E5|nr:PREDICTED: serine-rich adhesin for platelets-like [Rhagoletis zephyria]
MEAHTVKHPAFHHLHQANPPTNHLANHLSHNSLSASINTSSTSQPFAFGSSQSQGSSQQGSSASKLNFESSTAFPLLLSSISSESGLSGVGGVGSSVGGAGRSNAFSTPKAGVSFSRGSTSKGSSTFGSLSTGLHNAATAGNLSNHSASSQLSLAQQFTSAQLGAGKHKHASTATAGPPVDHQQFALSSNSNISSHPLTNGIAKGTPRPKASAPPNQLATFGPATPNGRGHLHQQLHLHGAKSTPGQQYLTDGGATVGATSALPFKKNLLARETSLNNNGTSSSRSKASPNKENNKGSTLSSSAQPPILPFTATALSAALSAPVAAIALAPTTGAAAVSTPARKASSNRSPTRAPGPKSTVNNDSNITSNNGGSSNSNANQHIHNLHNHVLVNGTASPQLPALDLSLETINFVASNHNVVLSPSSFTSKQKPKEFKFFKEKAKDKQQQKSSTAAGGTNNGCKDAQQSSAKSTSKSTSKAKSATTSSSSGASKKVNKGSATKADKSSGLLNKTKNNNSSPSSEVTKSRKQSVSTLSTVSNLSENRATLFPNDGAQMVIGEQPHLDTPVSERIVFFSESIIDGFAIQCFTDQESLELSLQDAVKHDLTVLHNFAINSSSTTATSTTTTATTSPSTGNSSQLHLHPTPTASSVRPTVTGKEDVGDQQCALVGEARPSAEGPKNHSTSAPSSSPTSTALQSFHQPQPLVSAPSVRITFEQREALPLPLSTYSKGKTPNKRRPSLVSPTRRPRKQSQSKNSKTSKGKKTTATNSKTSKKPMAKDSKSKKAKPTGKAKKEAASDSDDSDDEELDENVDEEVEDEEKDGDEISTVKASHKSKLKVKATKCTHKHPRTQVACNRCLLQQTQKKPKNAVGKKKQTTIKMTNKKVKASRTNRSGATSTTSSSAEASAASSATTSGPPATTTSDNADVDLSSKKNSKTKKMPNKTKSAGAASTSAKGKRSASNKRSQSDNSSNEDEEDSSDSESESEEEAEPLTSPRRGRNCAKKVPKAAKSAKRPKIEAGHTNELEDDDDDDDDEDEAAESSESDVPEQPSAASKKAPKRSTARGSKASSKQTKKKSSPTKKNNKGGKGVKKAKKDADSDADDEENEEEDANLTDHDDEEQAEQIVTDVEMEEEAADKGVEKTKKQTTGRGEQQQVKAKKATGKSTRASPSKQAAGSSKGKTSKGENKASSGRKSSAAKGASKKSANDQSDDDTEQSEQEEEEVAAVEGAGEQQPKQRQSHGKSSSANTKNKCDKSKSKSSSAGNASSTSSSAATSSTAACPVKDVYTFELSPVEVPSASFVLSSGQENKARVEDQNKTEQSETLSTAVNTLNAIPEETGSTSANANTVVKGSFSPQIVSGSSSSPSSSSVNRDGPAFEPLRPDSYSLYEPSYGPNVSLSSLSQLSQSIGGGAGGPILLNHQQQSSLPPTSSLANSKCSINIKEEPREDSLQSPFRVAHPKASTSMHQTPPPVIGDHHSASQHYGVNFASSVNNKATHPRRLWSNASAGSLISSSSSSSSSPVQLAFGQCPPGQPPTPATPASLASYFTPSSSLPALSSPFYPPNSQDLIRRDLDSRILASTAADRNLLAASLGITPSVGAVVQHPQPQPPPLQQQQQSSSQTPFNHAPTSAMIPPAPTAPAAVGSPLIAPCSSASFVPSGSPYPLPPHLNSQATFTPCVPTNRPTNQVQDLSAESPLRISSPASRSQSPREKPPMTSLKKGRWGSMHITIAHNIQLSMTGRSHAFPITGANNVPTATTPLAKSTPIISHSRPSSKGSVKTFEPHAVPHSVYAPRVSSPAKGGATAPMSLKSSQDAASTALVNSIRPASVASSTFNTTNYPPRFGTPTFGTPSMSAPPMLPGLFPSPIPSPMSFPGFLADSWARPPFPGAIPPPPTTPNSAVPPTRPSVPFSFADYYNNANSASSFLSAFAAGARPPGEAFFAAQNRQATPESNNKPTASTSSTSTGGSGGNSGNSSHKRKHENHEHVLLKRRDPIKHADLVLLNHDMHHGTIMVYNLFAVQLSDNKVFGSKIGKAISSFDEGFDMDKQTFRYTCLGYCPDYIGPCLNLSLPETVCSGPVDKKP